MRKIPTVFVRDPYHPRHVTRTITPGCEWVFDDPKATPTRKYDGTCVAFDGQSWFARREVKPDAVQPAEFIPVETDEVTGKTVGWEPIEQSGFAKYHAEALANGRRAGGGHWIKSPWGKGTYELVGPKINRNPEQADNHQLWSHAHAEQLQLADPDFDSLAEFLATFDGEGIVWHHEDGRMAKLKRRDIYGVRAR